MKKTLIVAMLLALCGVQVRAAAVSSAGGKKQVIRMNDANGNPILFDTDKPWKVFESTGVGAVQIVDESGVAPKQGMVGRLLLSTGAVSNYCVLADSNTTSGLTSVTTGKFLTAPFAYQTSLGQDLVIGALFTSGLVVINNANVSAPGGCYVYWRELGGYR